MKKLLLASALTLALAGNTSASFQFVSVPLGTVGNEPSGSPGPYSWNLYFDVASPVTITSLGAFDSGSDGVFVSTVSVAIFDADTGQMVGSPISFTTADPGVLDGGFRYKSLGGGITLAAGFHGIVSAFGHSGMSSAYEPFGNLNHANPPATAFDDGAGLLSNLGSFRYQPQASGFTIPGSTAGYRATPEVAAGSFQFVSAIPEPSTYIASALLLLPFGIQAIRRIRK